MRVGMLSGVPIGAPGKFGGVTTSFPIVRSILRDSGVDAVHIKDLSRDAYNDNIDLLLFYTLGVAGEDNDRSKATAWIEFINRNMLYLPMVVILHDVKQVDQYPYTYEATKEILWDGIITHESGDAILWWIAKHFHHRHLHRINHPFFFVDSNFRNKKSFDKNIASTTRIAKAKHQEIVLEIASYLKDYMVSIYSSTDVPFYSDVLRKHTQHDLVKWIGQYSSYSEALAQQAFAIDLCIWESGGAASGARTQYSILEAIDCGCIPIGFDIWQYDGGYDGIWLPTPSLGGTGLSFTPEKYADIISSYKYDFEVAIENKRRMKEQCDPALIGQQLKTILERSI
jgi:hypothetical protein